MMDERLNKTVREVLGMASDLLRTAPKPNQDPKHWMRRAKDFTDVCMVNREISPEIAPAIAFDQRGEFLRALKAIASAAGSYDGSLGHNVDSGLAIVTKVLSREVAIEGRPRFSVHSVREMARHLTPLQKQLFDAVWNHYVKSEKALPVRAVLPLIGKQPIEEVLKGLNGGLIYEGNDDNARSLTITLHGAFLTGHGAVLANLLVGILDLTKKLFIADHTLERFDSSKIKAALGDESALLLLRLLKKMLPGRFPIYVSNVSPDGSWVVAVRDEHVIKLYQSDDTAAYLDEMLSDAYRADEPCSYDERQARSAVDMAAAWDSVRNEPFRPLPIAPRPPAGAYIDRKRLEELRSIKNAKFDCSRLIAMCDELNGCAAAGYAHAVIMLTRAVLDHVPPVFGFDSFAQFAANYAGNKERSFKKAMERLDKHTKEVAHRMLHGQISPSEVAPNMSEVSYPGELNHLLSEVYRRLK